jgi:hypothetical protein
MPTTVSTILRHIFPLKSTCPACASIRYRASGSKGTIAYRTCTHCGERYKVFPVAVERDNGGLQSVIELL